MDLERKVNTTRVEMLLQRRMESDRGNDSPPL